MRHQGEAVALGGSRKAVALRYAFCSQSSCALRFVNQTIFEPRFGMAQPVMILLKCDRCIRLHLKYGNEM